MKIEVYNDCPPADIVIMWGAMDSQSLWLSKGDAKTLIDKLNDALGGYRE